MRLALPLLLILVLILLGIALCACGDGEATYDSPSFYLREIRKADVDVKGMRPYIVSPQACDALGEHCPDEVQLVAADDTYSEKIGPYIRALGSIAFPKPESALAKEVADALRREWETIEKVAQAPPREPPLRIVLNHYSRKRDPGNCVTIRATFSTAPDPLFDEEAAKERSVPGVLYMFWKTYQLAGTQPQLIEAGVEVTTRIQSIDWRRDIATIAEPQELPQTWTRDDMAGGHFFGYGGGVRFGVTWIDRSAGTKASDPWGATYRIEHLVESAKPKVTIAPLSAQWKAHLLALIERL